MDTALHWREGFLVPRYGGDSSSWPGFERWKRTSYCYKNNCRIVSSLQCIYPLFFLSFFCLRVLTKNCLIMAFQKPAPVESHNQECQLFSVTEWTRHFASFPRPTLFDSPAYWQGPGSLCFIGNHINISSRWWWHFTCVKQQAVYFARGEICRQKVLEALSILHNKEFIYTGMPHLYPELVELYVLDQ